MSSKKRKHQTLTLKIKMEILRKVDSGLKVTDIAKSYKVPRPTIYSIIKNRGKIETFVKTADSVTGSRQTTRCGEYKQMEEALYLWFIQERRRNTPITADIFKQKALYFYENIYKKTDFRASDGWLTKFKTRYGIRLLTVTGEQVSSDHAAVSPFIERFRQTIVELGLCDEQVYNADESGLFYKLLPKKSYVHQAEASAPGRKLLKNRITFMPCANAAGTHKLKLLVLGKSKNPRAFKNMPRLPVCYKNQKRAWVTREIFFEWFHENFVPEVRKFLKGKKLPIKALLVLDNAPGHGPNDVLASRDGNIKSMFLPPNCTPLLQPMDQNIIQMVKTQYKKKILLNAIGREHDISQALKELNLKDVVFGVAEAWDSVPARAIKSSWKKLWPSNFKTQEPWEPEDDVPLRELINTAARVNKNSDIDANDIEEWFKGDEEFEPVRTDNDIVMEVQETQEDHEDEDCIMVPQQNLVKSEEALSGIDVSIRWAEENSASLSTLCELRKFREEILAKVFHGKTQSKIDTFLIKH